MDAISPALGCFTTYVVDPIGARFQVSRNLKDNKKELEMSRDKLVARRDGQLGEIEEAKRQEGVEESAEAKIWFAQVDHALSDFKSLQNQYEQRKGPCPNYLCRSRYQLSKKFLKLKQVVDKLYEADPRTGWTAAPQLQKGTKRDTVSIEGQPTMEKLRGQIIDAVVDGRYVVVGLYGRGGVGKTTILRHANEYFRQTNDFEYLIFTTISITPNFVEIRKQIAQSLGLKNCQDDNDVKVKLSRFSFAVDRYLLILDDIWEPFDLGELYIPAPTKQNGCKILMASRLSSVVTRFGIPFAARDSLHLILMNGLTPDEAWNLFVQKVGVAIISKPEIYPLAREVLRNCDGLPSIIIEIGGKMSTRETEREWKDALPELDLQYSASKLEEVKKQQQQQVVDQEVKLIATHGQIQISVVLGDDILEFLRRMNRIFVNEAGTYLKFEFRGTLFSGPRWFNDNLLRYYDKDCHLSSYPFSKVQCNANEDPQPLIQPRQVLLPTRLTHVGDTSPTRIVTHSLGYDSAFTYNGYCFIGRITTVFDIFRDKDVLNMFFRVSNLGPNCYVDAKATTFFVLDNQASHFTNDAKVVPRFI